MLYDQGPGLYIHMLVLYQLPTAGLPVFHILQMIVAECRSFIEEPVSTGSSIRTGITVWLAFHLEKLHYTSIFPALICDYSFRAGI